MKIATYRLLHTNIRPGLPPRQAVIKLLPVSDAVARRTSQSIVRMGWLAAAFLAVGLVT
jgi:hypothetical protein